MKGSNSFLSSSVFSVGVNLLVKTFWILFVEIAVQRELGNEMYGKYFSLFNFSMFFLLLTDFGINNYNTRNISFTSKLNDFGKLFSAKMLLFLCYIAVVFVSALLFVEDKKDCLIMLMVALCQGLAGIVLFLRSTLTGLHMFVKDGSISIIDRVILSILCISAIYFLQIKFTIYYFLLFQIVGYSIAILTAVLVLKNHVGPFFSKINFSVLKEIFMKGLPFSILFLAMSIYMRMDGFLIKVLLPDGDVQAGVYASSYRLLEAFMQITLIITNILLPIFTKEILEKKSITKTLEAAFNLLIPVSIFMCIVIYHFRFEIAQFLYKEHITDIARLLPKAFLFSIPFCISLLLGTVLTAGGKFSILNKLAIILALLNIISHIIFIPLFKIDGAIMVTTFTHLISAFILLIYTILLYKYKFSFVLFFKYIIYSGFNYFLLYFVHQNFRKEYIVIAIVSNIVFYLIFKFVDFRQFKPILLSKLNK